ncbi:MAG: hypothetical protein JWR03_692 [Cohnella sp.]|nr:hypothetical protein [Cohnella sp.]
MRNNRETKITFLGTSGSMPDRDGDSASFLINDRHLVDTGWSSVNNLRTIGVDPSDVDYLVFTHLHHDHYVSLPTFLFFWLMKGRALNELNIIGPVEDVTQVVELAMDFLQTDRFYPDSGYPHIIPLFPGERYENEDFALDTCATLHPVQGLCYRFTDKHTGKGFSFTGDTAYYPPLIEHVKDSAVLIHEASLGPVAADPANNTYLHSGAIDAAEIAKAAGVGKLVLIHGASSTAEPCIEAAKSIFAGEVVWPKPGQTVLL